MTDDPTLPGRMRAALARLELLSHGSTQAWNKSGSPGGEPDDRMVAQVAARPDTPPHVLYACLWRAAENDEERVRVVKAAEREHSEWTGQVERKRVQGKTFDEVVLEDGEGYAPEQVGHHHGVDPAFIRRIRLKHGRHAETGMRLDGSGGSRPERARQLRQAGLSTRRIADSLGVAQTQVMRWIRDAA